MNRIIRTLFFAAFAPVLLIAQQESFITGVILSDETSESLVGVTVMIPGTNIGTVSALDGSFTLKNVPPGTHSVQFSMIGYETKTFDRISASAKPKPMTVRLSEQAVELNEVIIQRDVLRRSQDDARISVQKLQPREAKILPGAAEDVMRSLQALPGVLAPNDFSSQLIVRGSGPDQNLVIMDNIEVFNPYRLYGAISMFNPETVSDISLISGGFSARYGDRLSAVLDVTNRNGRSQKPIYGNLNTSLTNANLVLEGQSPFDIKGSWLLSSRRTYYDLIVGPLARNAGLVSGDVAFPNFGDVQAKAAFGPFDGHRIVVNGITSRDGVDIVSGDKRETPDSVSVFNTLYNNVIGVTWSYTPSTSVLNTFTASYYETHGGTEFDGRFLDPVLNRDDFSGEQNDSLKALARLFGLSFTNEFSFRKFSLRDDFLITSGTHTIEAGIGWDRVGTDLMFNLRLSPELRSIIAANPRSSAIIENTLQAQDYDKLSLYVQDKIGVFGNLYLQPGIRLDYYGLLRRVHVSPRFNFSYALTPITTIRGAAGLYLQSPGYEKLFDQNQFFDFSEQNLSGLRPEKSTHIVLGLERWVSFEWLAKAEVYYKKFSDLLVQERVPGVRWVSSPIPGADHTVPGGWTQPYLIAADSATSVPVNDSYGDAYGIELMLEKRNAVNKDRLSGWISYSLAWAQRYRSGAMIPFNFDQRHTANIVATYRFNDWLEGGMFWRFGSNFPATRPVGTRPRIVMDNGVPIVATDFRGRVILDLDYGDESNINQIRKPFYHRLDVRLTAYTHFWSLDWSFYLDVINVYNQQNVAAYRYSIDANGDIGQREVNMFPILPTIGLSARF